MVIDEGRGQFVPETSGHIYNLVSYVSPGTWGRRLAERYHPMWRNSGRRSDVSVWPATVDPCDGRVK